MRSGRSNPSPEPNPQRQQHPMNCSLYPYLFVLLLGLLPLSSLSEAATVRVAVASNFSPSLKGLAEDFTEQTGHEVLTSPGSTGKLYAQIRHGAPYDLFFAADSVRPAALEERGLALERRTYCYGRLVLWSSRPGLIAGSSAVLESESFRHLAIANPKTAPYGAAALQVLQGLGVLERLSSRLVLGENIGQAHHFVASGSAEIGFVALSQLTTAKPGSRWEVPESAHDPIEQQLVRLTDNPAALAFLAYLERPAVRTKLAGLGYRLPEE
jgi:molybdate transport system substrate-binding protein